MKRYPELKVLGPIVGLVAIAVVHALVREQISAEVLGHDLAVLSHPFAILPQKPIAITVLAAEHLSLALSSLPSKRRNVRRLTSNLPATVVRRAQLARHNLTAAARDPASAPSPTPWAERDIRLGITMLEDPLVVGVAVATRHG